MEMKTNIEFLFCLFEFTLFSISVRNIFILFIKYALLTSHPFFENETALLWKELGMKYLSL